MRTIVLATVAAMAATSAFAETVTKIQTPVMGPIISGEVSLDFAETTNNNYGGTFNLDLGIDVDGLATVDLDFAVDEDGNGSLDDWTVGTTVGALGVAFGTDNGVMPETTANVAADGTLAAPAMTESVQVTAGAATVALGFTDWNTDITDISNVQGAYTLGVAGLDVTASADYNRTTENTVIGGEVGGLDLGMMTAGGMVTYDTDAEDWAFEGSVATGGLEAYINGSDDNRLQHIGGEYTMNVAGAELSAGVDYDTDAKDWTPTAGLSFNF